MKHVRCRDLHATWLFARQFGNTLIRYVVKTALRRKDRNQYYLRGMLRGARASFRYRVDRRTRLYADAR
jgi:hypothetical protein